MKIVTFIRNWILIFAILAGIGGYFLYAAIPALDGTHETAMSVISLLQPLLIFAMLFLTFCKVDARDLRLTRWHAWLIAIQAGLFLAIGAVVMMLPSSGLRIILEGAMICFICPVATASAVITRKLGGSASSITTYTILINLVVALLIPAVLPFVHPSASMTAFKASMLILSKVMPLLLAPLLLAFAIKRFAPRLCDMLTSCKDLAFYLWVVALTLATAVTTRIIVHSDVELYVALWLVAVTLVSCLAQFLLGWKIGGRYGDRITAGQALGQKNTVLAIWMGYTFFTPITAVTGGFYSIFHNLINSWQLARARHDSEKSQNPS